MHCPHPSHEASEKNGTRPLIICNCLPQQLFYVDVIFYIAGLAFIKFHVLLQYYRLFSVKMRRVTVWVTVLVCVWGLASTFAVIFICNPIPGAWDPGVSARCIPPMPQWYTNAAGNIITDFVIFCLPIRVLWRLKLERSQRISLLAVFGLGFFTCCISIIRISYLDILQGDETYHNVSTAGWSIGEMCCAMVASCVPTLRPLLYKVAPGLRRDTTPSSTGDLEHGEHILTLQTIGGSYVGSVGDGTRKERWAAKVAARNKSTSTDALTETDGDVELVMAMRDSMEKKLRSGSTSDGEMLPIQYPPPLHAADDLAGMLGLRVSTQTTVVATRPRETRAGLSPRLLGIRVKRDITQTHH